MVRGGVGRRHALFCCDAVRMRIQWAALCLFSTLLTHGGCGDSRHLYLHGPFAGFAGGGAFLPISTQRLPILLSPPRCLRDSFAAHTHFHVSYRICAFPRRVRLARHSAALLRSVNLATILIMTRALRRPTTPPHTTTPYHTATLRRGTRMHRTHRAYIYLHTAPCPAARAARAVKRAFPTALLPLPTYTTTHSTPAYTLHGARSNRYRGRSVNNQTWRSMNRNAKW